MNITLRQIQYFLSLADHQSFGRAAESMHVSQPALSMQIKELEAQLGVQLFERQPRRALLTGAGRDLLRYAQRVAGSVQDLQTAARWQNGLSGRITLGVIPTVAPFLLPVALPLLRGLDVTLQVSIREAQTQVLLAELADGRVDAAIVALPSEAADLIERPLFDDPFVLAGTRDQIARLYPDGVIRPQGLDPNQLLLLDEGHCLADQALEVCALRREQTRMDAGASSLATLCGLAAEGLGVTLLPMIAVQDSTTSHPKLSLQSFVSPQPQRCIGLIRRKTSRDDGWFGRLGDILSDAGQTLLSQSMAQLTCGA